MKRGSLDSFADGSVPWCSSYAVEKGSGSSNMDAWMCQFDFLLLAGMPVLVTPVGKTGNIAPHISLVVSKGRSQY